MNESLPDIMVNIIFKLGGRRMESHSSNFPLQRSSFFEVSRFECDEKRKKDDMGFWGWLDLGSISQVIDV